MMSFYSLHVGNASDPKFLWDGGDHCGNIPKVQMGLEGIGRWGCVKLMTVTTVVVVSWLGASWRHLD